MDDGRIIELDREDSPDADGNQPYARIESLREREKALACLRHLLEYLGEDPDREGLRDTPDRILRAWGDQFSGYRDDPEEVLERTFEEVAGYDDMILLKDVDFDSHCEHHMIPIQGVAHIAYVPSNRVVGLSKLARVVDIYARRLQTQETLSMQIAYTIEKVLAPRGLAVLIEAGHQCMATRGVAKKRARTVTTVFRGVFRESPVLESRFLRLIGSDTTA